MAVETPTSQVTVDTPPPPPPPPSPPPPAAGAEPAGPTPPWPTAAWIWTLAACAALAVALAGVGAWSLARELGRLEATVTALDGRIDRLDLRIAAEPAGHAASTTPGGTAELVYAAALFRQKLDQRRDSSALPLAEGLKIIDGLVGDKSISQEAGKTLKDTLKEALRGTGGALKEITVYGAKKLIDGWLDPKPTDKAPAPAADDRPVAIAICGAQPGRDRPRGTPPPPPPPPPPRCPTSVPGS